MNDGPNQDDNSKKENNRDKLLRTLIQMGGPVAIGSDLKAAYKILIAAAILLEEQNRPSNWDQTLALSATKNGAFTWFLIIYDCYVNDEKTRYIAPMDLVDASESRTISYFQSARARAIVEEYTASCDQQTLSQKVFELLQSDKRFRQTRPALKTNLVQSAKRLSALGLLHIREEKNGTRAKQITGIMLTDAGVEFGDLLIKIALSMSVDRHP